MFYSTSTFRALPRLLPGVVIAAASFATDVNAQSTSTGSAQAYPTKSIRLIVPYAAGGGVDIIARTTAQDLTKRVGQQIIVDNRTGGGGNVGSDLVAKSAPYGYTLLIASPANTINPSLYAKMRSLSLPDIPTFVESGFRDFVVSVWWGVMGPAAMPKEIVHQLNREIVAGLSSSQMKERLQTMSAQPIGGTAEQFAAFFAAETKRWAPIVKASGAKAD